MFREFRDPMAPESETEDEFSLMDVRKLINNLPKRKLEVTMPCLSVFVLWVSRICKSPAWKEIFMLCSHYLALFEANKEKTDFEGMTRRDKWSTFWGKFDQYKKDIYKGMSICNERSGSKMLDHYVKWVEAFEVVPE